MYPVTCEIDLIQMQIRRATVVFPTHSWVFPPVRNNIPYLTKLTVKWRAGPDGEEDNPSSRIKNYYLTQKALTSYKRKVFGYTIHLLPYVSLSDDSLS